VSRDNPRVSVGLAVYNGENFLAEAVDSVLQQTFRDFELIISDNASSDRTEEICRAYPARDPRVRYYRNENNMGAAWNYNRVFALSRGEYFKWAAHDDVLHPEFLSKTVRALDENPSVVLAFARVVTINAQGDPIKRDECGLRTDSAQPNIRFHDSVCTDEDGLSIFGVVRKDALKKTSLIASYVGSDRPLLAELLLVAPFYEVPEWLFFHRDHTQRSVRRLADLHQRVAWFDPVRRGRLTFPYWRQLKEFILAVHHSRLSWRERLRCYRHLCEWAWKIRRWLRWDIRFVVFDRGILRFFKRHAPGTRPLWHAYRRMVSR
jgi:glycosyltransferase involved in cell wall biosynthesis